jgi:hypothetical protein
MLNAGKLLICTASVANTFKNDYAVTSRTDQGDTT